MKNEPLIYKKTLEIELLDNCNLNCKLCQRINFKKTKLQLNIETILKAITDNKYERVLLMGTRSEPTLYSNLFDLIDTLQKRNIEIELYTNGTRSENFWKKLSTIINEKFIIVWCVSGINENDHFKYRQSSLKKLLNNVSVIPNALNFGLFLLFDYNTKEYSSPIKTKEIMKIDSEIHKHFDGILYSHSGDIYVRGELKAQDIKNYIVPFENQCIGNHINFLSMDGELFKCKIKYESLQEIGYIPEDICDGCNITFLPNIHDRFIMNSEVIFTKNYNEDKVFNIPYFLERKKK